jgi:hypothetical protein
VPGGRHSYVAQHGSHVVPAGQPVARQSEDGGGGPHVAGSSGLAPSMIDTPVAFALHALQ